MDIEAWLQGLGLERYAPAFRDNEIDWEVLPKLTSEDLREIGVAAVGHRRKLLGAIAALGASAPTAAVTAAVSGVAAPADAERRQLTVMFCDLVGSTPLSVRFDPEDLREIVGAYHRCVADTVGRFAGFVAKYMGDGVLVYFGYPEAHEDDAERAVRAGLAVIDAVGGLATPEPINVRLGIASGLVVVGDLIGAGAAQERGVVGETPNLAARLQALAQPGTLVIAESTRRQIGALFEVEDLGPQPLAGFAVPQRAWRVAGESGVLSRFEALRSEATPLVGRDEELDLLLRRWQQAKAGEGRVVLLSGEPGIGKSRLTVEVSQAIQSEPHTRLRYFCSPYHQDSALYPFIVQLERAAGFARDDTVDHKLGKVRELLGPDARDGVEIELVAELLSLPSSAADLNLSPQRKREMLFEALLHQFTALARSRPVLMIFEDAHWIDPTTRELLDLTLDRVTHLPVLLVVTFRSEFQHAWSGQPHVTMLALNRLGGHDGAALVERLAGNVGLSPEIVGEIVERADGVPLFVEELTKAVLETNAEVLAARAPPELAIPPTLHASLIARLDRLGPMAKEIAQVGAVIGREFGYELMELVSQRPSAELRLGLDRLAEAGLLFCRGVAPQCSYLFKHALVQDAAYGTLLRRRRRHLHARIAAILQAEFAEIAEARPELLAHHYSEAGLAQDAVAYWSKAGTRSMGRSAFSEAAAQFRKGLDQLKMLPENRERHRRELELTSTLGSALQAEKGFAAEETGVFYERARSFFDILDSPSEFFHVPLGQSFWHIYRGEFAQAFSQGENLLNRSRQSNVSGGLVLGHNIAGVSLLYMGNFAASRAHLEEMLELYDPTAHASLNPNMHVHVPALGYLGHVLFCMGYPNQAMAQCMAAIAEARKLSHPPDLAGSLTTTTRLLSLMGDYLALNGRARELVGLTTERGFPFWGAMGTICIGWAKVNSGELIQGTSLLCEGSAVYRATGALAWVPYHLALLARARELAGEIDQALEDVDEALGIAGKTDERWLMPELMRQKAQLLARTPNTTAAEELYKTALLIAIEQDAKLWQLRTATSLARLWGEQGRRPEARDLLAPIYEWFTEGFDTPDLKAAKALLDELT